MSEPEKPRSEAWLLRTQNNRLQGPFGYDQICQMIREGKVQLDDEVCAANEYWFYLHERAEVKRWLGVEFPKPVRKGSEGTDDGETQTDLGQVARQAAAASAAKDISDFEAGAVHESTQVLSRPTKAASASSATTAASATKTHAAASKPPVPVPPLPPTVSSTASSFFKNFGWLLISGVALVVYLVLRMTRLQ